MKKTKQQECVLVDRERLLEELESEDEAIRAKALRSLCPCHGDWKMFEENLLLVERFRKDPSPLVRRTALHLFEDAGEISTEGYQTNPREVTNDMLRARRASRFAPDEEELEAVKRKHAQKQASRGKFSVR